MRYFDAYLSSCYCGACCSICRLSVLAANLIQIDLRIRAGATFRTLLPFVPTCLCRPMGLIQREHDCACGSGSVVTAHTHIKALPFTSPLEAWKSSQHRKHFSKLINETGGSRCNPGFSAALILTTNYDQPNRITMPSRRAKIIVVDKVKSTKNFQMIKM